MTDDKNEMFANNKALPFFGKITASFTHELNNIISIIDQSAGLLEDLLPGDDSARVPIDKFTTTIGKIKKHASRGIVLIKNLNTFSHGVDSLAPTINMKDVIGNLMALIDRTLRNTGVTIDITLETKDSILRNNPFMIQQILYMVIEKILVYASKGDIIKIIMEEKDKMVNITLSCSLKENISQIDFRDVSKLANTINGIVRAEVGDNNISVFFQFKDLETQQNGLS